MTVADDLTATLRAAPDLYVAPSLAVPAAQTADPIGTGEVLAHAANLQAQDKAYADLSKKHGNVFTTGLHWVGAVAHDAGAVAGRALKLANAPLQEMQHQYRYIRDVQQRHGGLAAALEGLAIGIGAVGGGFVGGTEGAGLGGELVAGVLGRVLYHDSWERTTDGAKYRDEAGHVVSIGRDVGHLIGLKDGSTAFKALSGVTDGLADLTLDPLALAGGAVAGARGVEGAGGALKARFGGLAMSSPEDVERAFSQYPSFRRAVGAIAGMDAGQVTTNFPKFAAISGELGAARTADEVVDVFRDATKTAELARVTPGLLPTRTFTSIPFSRLREAIGNYEGPGANTVRQVSSLLPRVLESDTLEQSGREVDLAGRDWHKPVYDTLRMGQSRRTAESVVAVMAAEADPAARRAIFKNAMVDSLVARGVPSDSDALRRITASLDDLTATKDAVYGVNAEGRDISRIALDDGRTTAGGISLNQIGKVALPRYDAVLHEVRAVNGARRWLGVADDFAWDKFTMSVFKPLVLLSLGFAQRVAMAEAIPNALRTGFFNYVKSGLNQLDTRLGERWTEEEVPHVAAAVQKVLGGVNKAVQNPADIELAARNVHALGGHVLPPALDSSHGGIAAIGGPSEKAYNDLLRGYQRAAPRVVGTDAFRLYNNNEPEFIDMWQRALSEHSNDPLFKTAADGYLGAMRAGASEADATRRAVVATKQAIDDLPPETLANELRHRFMSPDAPPGTDPHEDWARVVVESLKGTTHGSDGVPHVQLLRDIADGTVTKRGDLEAIAQEARPVTVKGRILKPDPESTIEKIANWGHTKVLGPIINTLARDPIYFAELKKEYGALGKLIDEGYMTADEALGIAQVRATRGVLPFIHNPAERSQMSVSLRNLAPFYFAQTQAYRRLGRLATEDFGAFRQYQLAMVGLHDVAFHTTDSGGQQHLIYPGSGFLGRYVPAILGRLGIHVAGSVPVAFSGSVKSLASVSPFLEGDPRRFGPLVGIPAHLIENFQPETAPITHAIEGEQQAAGSVWEQFVPNVTLKRVIQAFAGTHQRAFQGAMMSTIQALSHEQELHPDRQIVPGPDAGPMEQQSFIDRVKNHTRILYLLKAAIGAVSPLSPQFEIGDVGIQEEMRTLQRKHGLAEGTRLFLEAHPDATPYTVFKSKTVTGAPLNASDVAQSWINTHGDLMKKYPYAAAWLIPQETSPKFSPAIYNEQLAQHLRVRKAPEQMLKDLYTAAGFQKYEAAVKERDAALAATTDPTAQASVHHAFSQYISTVLGPQNPVWFDYFQSADREHARQLAVAQLRGLFDSKAAPKSVQSTDIRGLLEDFDHYQANRIVGRSDSYAADANRTLKDAWQRYLEQLAAQKPNLAPIIGKVFKELT